MTRKLSIPVLALAVLITAAPARLGAQTRPAGKAKAPAALDAAAALKAMHFRPIGPTQQSGRFVDFAVPPGKPNTFYAASASGGLWKTENNGQTFEPLFENEKVYSIGDIAVAPSDPAIIWLGSGEANNSRSTYWGDGVYKSVDAGKTWVNMGLRESHHIGRIVVHPADPDIVYVAALGHLYSENPERGLYKTTDGGKTWAKVLDIAVDGRAVGVVDAVMDPSAPDTLYAAAYDKFRKPWTWGIGGPGSGIHKTTDGGKSWTRLTNGLPGGIIGRIGLTVFPKNPKILYAEIENANKPGVSAGDRWKEVLEGKSSAGMIDGEIYRSDDAGATWTKVSPEKRSIGGNPGYYYGQIVVDPNDANLVYILSVGVLASRDGGKTWDAPFRFGGDNHALWIDPKDSKHMLLGYDHGLGVTWDGGKNWHHPDFLPLAQFYAIDFDMSYPYRVAGGLQDNGSLMGPSTNVGAGGGFGGRGAAAPPIRLEDWFGMGGGDGMYNVFDRTTNATLYNESQFGTLSRVDLVTGEARSIAYQRLKPDTRWNWCAPILVSVHNSDTVYHCGNIVVMSTNRGESWTEVSPDLSTNDPTKLTVEGRGGDGNIQYCTITTFDESPLVPGLLWAGTDDGNVWVTRDNGKAWVKLNDNIPGNPGYWVSRVAASPSDPGTAYVSYTGFRNDDFRPFLYKTTDYGATWTSSGGGTRRGAGQCRPRGPQERQAPVRRDRFRRLCLFRRRPDLDEGEGEPADAADPRSQDPPSGGRSHRGHTRPRGLHRRRPAAPGAHARRPGQGRPSLHGRAEGPLGGPGPPRIQQLELRRRERVPGAGHFVSLESQAEGRRESPGLCRDPARQRDRRDIRSRAQYRHLEYDRPEGTHAGRKEGGPGGHAPGPGDGLRRSHGRPELRLLPGPTGRLSDRPDGRREVADGLGHGAQGSRVTETGL